MGKGVPLSGYEKGKIDALKTSGRSNREIAKELNRSPNLINNYINLGSNYGAKKSPGRRKKLTLRERRAIVKAAVDSNYGSKRILKELSLNCSPVTIWTALKEDKNIALAKKKRKPNLKEKHKKDRLEFAKKHMTWTTELNSIVWSDEKKFNLDGPDGYRCYWHDLSKEEKILSRVQGGGSVMIWPAFGSKGRTRIVFCKGKMNSEKYIKMLEDELLPVGHNLGGENWTFQQDNAPIHVSKKSKSWFEEKRIRRFEHPPLTPI